MTLPPPPQQGQPQQNDDSLTPNIDFGQIAASLPLNPAVGRTFVPGVRTSNTGRAANGLPRLSTNAARYETIPPDAVTQRDVAFQTLTSLANSEKLSPWNTASIRNNVRSLVDAPQAAYILSNPAIIDEWQSTIYSHTLSSLGDAANKTGQNDVNNPNIVDAQWVADFFNEWDSTLDSNERTFISSLLAAMPDARKILEQSNVKPEGTGFWADLKLGWRTITRAPEAIRPVVNDPRKQLISEMHQWLKSNDLSSLQDRSEFVMFVHERATNSIQEVAANRSGFFALAEATVALPFTTAGNELNDWLNRSADPNSFASRAHLSLGQNSAIGLGVNPGDQWYTTTSGFLDGMYGIVLDPQNIVFGVGNGIKNAARVPRAVSMSKVDAFQDAFRLFGGGRKMNLPVFDRGIISRFSYATFSKTVDQVVETQRVKGLVSRLSKLDSESAIVELMPSWRGSTKLVGWVSRTTDERVIKELLRAGMKHPESLADDSPLLANRTTAELVNAVTRHRSNLQEFLGSGGSLQDLSSMDEIQDVLVRVRLPQSAGDAGALKTVVRKSVKYADQPEFARVIVGQNQEMVVRGSKDTLFGYDAETGQLMGGIITGAGRMPIVGTAIEHQEKGVYTALKELIPNYGAGRAPTSPQSDVALAANNMDNPFLFRRGVMGTGDGKTKFAVTTLGTSGKQPIELDKILFEVSDYLDAADLGDDAIKMAAGQPMSALSGEGQQAVRRFVQAKGHDFGSLGSEMVVTPEGQKMLLRGTDTAGTGRVAFDELRDSYKSVVEAQTRYRDIHNKMDARLWVVKDTGLQLPSRTRQLRLAAASKSNASFVRGMRRSGFRITHRMPTNITLTETGEGAQQLRNWIKALGGNDDLANKWADAFRAGNSGTRKDIILEALQEVGDQIENPMLRDGVLQFGNKQGQYTYFYDRAGNELGLAADGSIMPMTLAHFTDNFAMPDAKMVLRSMKRFQQAKRMPGTRRGLNITGTRARRKELAQSLRARLKKVGVHDVPEEDLYAMAYADILGGEYGRATGFGAVARAAGMMSSAYHGFHHVFVIAQLAFRPIAWASRVLLEETVRADLMALPSMWRNPYDWAMQVADAAAIRKLPQELQQQGEVAESLVNGLFRSGKLDMNATRKIIPDIETLFEAEGILPSHTQRAQAFIGHYVSKELTGLGVTEGQLGARANIVRKAAKRERSLRRTFAKMDVDGMADNFRWDIDGQEIAQRSFWSQFVTEAEASTQVLEYAVGNMTPRGLQTYGRGYGRQVYQMSRDPIVSTYGFNRAISNAAGSSTRYTGDHLVASSHWGRIKHIVDKKLDGDGVLAGMSEVQKADWYLTQVDEIVSTLFDPLANGDLAEKARILRGIRNGGTVKLNVGSVEHVLNASESNYEGFVRTMANVTESAYNENRQLPQKIAAYLDPRFGQADQVNGFRRFTDWAMMKFGEEATQKMNRQPAYRHIRGRWYRYYTGLGWDQDTARIAAAEKAAEQVNWIFFDNNNIPGFLKDMNQVIPFFSAMWEVGSTWMYKIPSVNVLPVGYAQLGRRVERTIRGLRATGLVEYDVENNQMTLNMSADMGNANGPLAKALGRTLFEYTRLPITMLEYLGGVKNLIMDQEFDKGDLSDWAKDGFSIGIGNPLDPTSHGLMAVNQFSVGATPLLQLPISMGANAVFAQDDERIDVDPETTLGTFLLANEDLDMAQILRANQDAFIEANGEELFNRALGGNFNLEDIIVPTTLRIPDTSTWEMLTNRMVFPFGRMESAGELITAASPSAMNYVWRGLLQKFGGEGADEIAGMLFGQMAGYTMASEVVSQIQMIEAADGSVSEIMDMAAEAWAIVESLNLQVQQDEDSSPIILNANSEEAERAQQLFNDIHTKNARLLKRANDNAAGAQIMRGVMGQLGPVTPRMQAREQEQIATYWSAREMAKEAEVTGSVNYGKLLADTGAGIHSFLDLQRLGELSAAWLNDSTGDEAKVWLAQQNPGLLVFTQGKSYWGPAGPPPQIELFDDWVEQVEAGDRKPFKPEVFMARYQRTGVAIDREIEIINSYGPDPDSAAVAILQDYNTYKDKVDEHNQKYDALEFLDSYLYDGAYDAYRKTDLDDLAVYELLEEKKRNIQEDIDAVQDLLSYGDLEPDERRRMIGVLNSHVRAYSDAIEEGSQFEDDDRFLNPREVVLDRYWQLSNEYYEERNVLFGQLTEVQDKTDRAIIFEALRGVSDKWYDQNHTIEGWSGRQLTVPAPEVRSWNGKPQQERQERILAMIGKRPEWLSRFEAELLVNESPDFAGVLPVTAEQRRIYDEAALQKWEIRKIWAANPTAFTKSKRDQMVGEVDDAKEAALIAMGRGDEVAYANMVPFMRLARTGLLPPSLDAVVPKVAQILEQLVAMEKSPRTNDGYALFMQLRGWLENTYYAQHPQARTDIGMLGSAMFGEVVPSAVYARLFQADYFGELG